MKKKKSACCWGIRCNRLLLNFAAAAKSDNHKCWWSLSNCLSYPNRHPSVRLSVWQAREAAMPLAMFPCALLLISSQASAPTMTLGSSLSCVPSLIFFSSFYSLVPLHSPTSLLDSTPRVPCSWLIVPHGNVFHVEVRDHLLVCFLKFPQCWGLVESLIG